MNARTPLLGLALLAGLSSAACGSRAEEPRLDSRLGFDEARSEVVVLLNRQLHDGEHVHARVRSLADGDHLDCGAMLGEMPSFAAYGDNGEDHVYGGEVVERSQFDTPTSSAMLRGETEDELRARMEQTYFVDVCIANDEGIVHQARYSIQQALDRIGRDGKFDGDEEVLIDSNVAYAQACEAELGAIPFFAPVLDENGEPVPGDFGVANCLDGVPLATEIDGEPQADAPDQCDDPQYIYSHCEPDARTGANGPRVQSAVNDEGSHWVLLCRKSLDDEGWYNDIAMIGHNPGTGKTCFFQNQLRGSNSNHTPDSNGMEVPSPRDEVASDQSPRQSTDLWLTEPEGGSNDGIACAGCHDADPFVHSPWIDTAKREDGTPVVPRMGQHEAFVEGYNRPYSLVNQDGQGWTIPRRLVSEEAAACTNCHSMARGQWMSPSNSSGDELGEGCNFCGSAPWLDRLAGTDESWMDLLTESHRTFEEVFWMPPEVMDEFDATADPDAPNPDPELVALWQGSKFGQAVNFMLECGANPDDERCVWEDAPRQVGSPDELPEVAESGEELARLSLAALGARHLDADGGEVEQTRRCADCHSVSRFGLREWRDRTLEAIEAGIDFRSDVESLSQEEARALVDFMRTDQEDPDSVFAAYRIGVMAAGAQFPYFQRLFKRAFGGSWAFEYNRFLARVGMPKGTAQPLTAESFARVLAWFTDENLDNLDVVMPEAPRPTTCAEVNTLVGLDADGFPADDSWFQDHLSDMEFEGWGARNQVAGIDMFGCDGGDALGCFAASDFARPGFEAADGIEGLQVAEVRKLDFRTSFWTRSSADGRFVGNGGSSLSGHGATITDLLTGRNIGVSGSYDPGFFPNNDGFIMQGGAGVCGQSVLTDESLFGDGIDFTEPGCSRAQGVQLYQHVAVSLDGGDYFIINAQFTSDAGGGTTDPTAGFGEGSEMRFHPMVFDGSDWTQKETVHVRSPYEGDSVLSPSAQMVVSRFAGPEGRALGYMFRRVRATPSGNSYQISIEQPVRFVCAPGAKANISFGERYAVTHHYENETANIYLTDLLTNETHQVTDMPAGVRALFPHFRSDGWIYFLVKDGETDRLMATDAALRLSAQP